MKLLTPNMHTPSVVSLLLAVLCRLHRGAGTFHLWQCPPALQQFLGLVFRLIACLAPVGEILAGYLRT